MRITHTIARRVVCFFVLPALWAAGSVFTGWHAVLMIPAAVVIALLSTLTAYRSGRGKPGALGYFLGTGVMLGVAFAIATVTLLAIYCGDSTEGAC